MVEQEGFGIGFTKIFHHDGPWEGVILVVGLPLVCELLCDGWDKGEVGGVWEHPGEKDLDVILCFCHFVS